MDMEEYYRDQCAEKGPECLAMFEKIFKAEKSAGFACMLALKSPPSLQTDTTWLAGHPSSNDRMEGMTAKASKSVLARAKKAGVSTAGMVHIAQMGPAEDPSSWVDGKADMIRKAAHKNVTLKENGKVIHEAIVKPKKEAPVLAKDKIVELAHMHKFANPGCKLKGQELGEMIVDKHAYKGSGAILKKAKEK
jgi:hypothetical protein